MILTLSHGQAAIERGFSTNKDLLETNMLEQTIIAQRMICDSVKKELPKEDCSDVSKVNVNKEMLRYCSRARGRYDSYLAERKEKLKKNVVETKKNEIREELESEKKLNKNWVNSYDRHVKNAV